MSASNHAMLFGSIRSVKDMRLQVSPNGRYLMDHTGRPFFYLADTAWRLFKALSHDELELYLQNRAAKGFNAIQAYVLRGLKAPNRYGEFPLIGDDPTRPNEAFFQNVDYVIDRANTLGMVMGCVACFGQHVTDGPYGPHHEVIFTPDNARVFGRFLGNRYKDHCVVWYLGGDRVPDESRDIWIAMALGLKEGCAGRHLVSYHGPGIPETPSSSCWFHDEAWLDFNTIQSGHGWTCNCYDYITHDYQLTPRKPTIDMEASYENHHDGRMHTGKRIDAHQVREFIYWNILAGAAGHGYGCHDVWPFGDELDVADYTFAQRDVQLWRHNTHWSYALNLPGAVHVGLARKLFEERPWYRLLPDQSVISKGQGEGEEHVQAAIADDGSFLLAYLPCGNPVGIDLERLTGATVHAKWYNPRDGRFYDIGVFSTTAPAQFTPPTNYDREDWVLVVDAAKIATDATSRNGDR